MALHESRIAYFWRNLSDAKRYILPGATITTSVFGRVATTRDVTGEPVGVIPDWFQREVLAHGFKVIGADFRAQTYTLILLEDLGRSRSGFRRGETKPDEKDGSCTASA